MDLLDRLLRHDAWTTRQLLENCATLPDDALDREHDIGHRTLRRTLHHIVDNMEVWYALMAHKPVVRETDRSVAGMLRRVDAAEALSISLCRAVADREGWNELWTDYLDNPPVERTYGTAIAHVITHGMHHRAQVLYLLRLSGVKDLPEGDLFTWEKAAGLKPGIWNG